MPRRPNRFGGGAQTNVNGLRFEQNTLLDEALQEIGFEVREYHVYNGDEKIGMSVPKHKLYTIFLERCISIIRNITRSVGSQMNVLLTKRKKQLIL